MTGNDTNFVTTVKAFRTHCVVEGFRQRLYAIRMRDQAPSIASAQESLRQWLDEGLKERGRGSAAALARDLGIPSSRISEMRSGDRMIQAHELAGIVKFLRKAIPTELTPWRAQPSIIPVVGTAMAGKWVKGTGEEPEEILAVPLPEAERLTPNKFALRVEGRSMDKIFRPGSILICAKLSDIQENDRVVAGGIYIVKRIRRDGLVEITAKEAAQDENGAWWLWPRSSDPAFQSPYPLQGTDDYKIEIDARVIWGMSSFWKVGQE